jgi:two-component system, NtrC family, sensor histidine kinase HydH
MIPSHMLPAVLQIALVEWGSDFVVRNADGDCEHVFGAATTALVGKKITELLPVDEGLLGQLSARLTPGEHDQVVEFVPHLREGARVWYRMVLGRGQQKGIVQAAVSDFTQWLHGSPPVQISNLSSSLSHELRNPLSSIKMAVQTLARNTDLSERDQRRLVIANREVRTMERMLSVFSEYGRQSPPNSESVSAKALIQEAASLVEPELGERKVRVEISERAEGLKVRADSGRLRPVIAQLLMNIAMGQEHDSVLTVSLAKDREGVAFEFADKAATIVPEEQNTLFEPFGSRLARGAGLSLASLSRVVRSHGGTVSARNLSPTGTSYLLVLPS